MDPGGIWALFNPRRIALVGASDQPGRLGRLLWDNLATFPGEVIPIRPSAEPIDGRVAYPTLRSVPGDIDLAVVAAPAAAVPGVAADAAAKGVTAMVVLAGGFAETGEAGTALQDRLRDITRAAGIRVIGPNGLGIQNCDLPLNASMATGLAPGGGGISLVTQSGAYGMAIHMLGVEEHARFAKVASVGNQIDVSSADLLRWFVADPATTVACFFLESLPDGRAFYEAAQQAGDLPVIVARTGRSVAGARAARSHTAALAGALDIEWGALQQAGVIQVRTGLEMMDVARALSDQPLPAGARVGVVTNSGGTGVELTDLLAAEGLDVPPLSPALQADLSAVLPMQGSAVNPIDVTPAWERFGELYPIVVDRLARSREVDAIIVVLLQRAAADETVATGLRDTVARLRATDAASVPVYVCWVAPRTARANADQLQAAGIPCFDWPERTARTLGHVVRYALSCRVDTQQAASRSAASHRTQGPSRALTASPLTSSAPGRMMATATAHDVLSATGIALAESRICSTSRDAVAAAHSIGYPVVAKVVHPSIVHRSDIGGVRTGLRNAEAVEVAAHHLLSLVDGALVLVQPQLTGVEVVIGGVRDDSFGPAVMVGFGGVYVEILADVAFAPAPIDDHQTQRLWERLRGYPLLTGTRGSASVDLPALRLLTRHVAELLIAQPRITELDLNPVIATPSGAYPVDWRIFEA